MTADKHHVPNETELDSRIKPQSITALLIVHNEEHYIRDALESIAGIVDHIMVVHHGQCDDNTLSIAAEFTHDVSCMTGRMGSAEFIRPQALERCSGDWVLVLDADERISTELRDSLRTLVNNRAADCYGFAWPYVSNDGEAIGRVSVSAKRFLFRRSQMYTIGLPHMTPDSYGTNISRRDLTVWHVMKHPDAVYQLRRSHRINRRRGRMTAMILSEGPAVVSTFNADLADKRVKNIRKIQLFAHHPFLALVTVPAYGFLQAYFVRGYYRAGLIGLHDALNIPVFHAWTCLYRIRDLLMGKPAST
jgi:glycosyltransferase involved in cell wall biosynthesis